MLVRIQNDDKFEMTFNTDFLNLLPLTKIKNIFKIMLRYSYKNTDAITTISRYISDELVKTKAAYTEACTEYHDRYRCIDTRGYMAPANVTSKLNKPLVSKVKSAKSDYERIVKINKYFCEFERKYNYVSK